MLQAAFTAFQIGSSLIEGSNKRALERAQRRAAAAVAEGNARVQTAGNFRSAAQADLARAVQSIGNRRMREQATRREAAARASVLAQRDSDSAGTFERRIAASEAAGALAGLSGSSGVTGGSYDIIAGAQALTQARQDFNLRRAGRARDYGLEVDAADAARTAVTGLDNKTVFATIDRSVAAAPAPGNQSNALTDLFRGTSPEKLVGLAEQITQQAQGWFRPSVPIAAEFQTGLPMKGFDRVGEGT